MTKSSPRLFTPGPLSTSAKVRAAAAADLGSRTPAAAALTAKLQTEIAGIAGCGEEYVVIPVQGSGTFAVEAMLSSMVGDENHVLVIVNGIYSARMAAICEIHGIRHTVLKADPYKSFDLAEIETRLSTTADISHIASVHFETGLGVLNDIDALAAVASRHGSLLLVDAISTFGALPLDISLGTIGAMALSANKCLHGLPGIGFVIAKRSAAPKLVRPRTLSLDLWAQYRGLQTNGQWRFTPPLQVMLALEQAIREFHAGGGRIARYQHYSRLAERLVRGLHDIGMVPVIEAGYRAPMIITFAPRPDLARNIDGLDDFLLLRDLVIYPSKHWDLNSFRVGLIGDLDVDDIERLLTALGEFFDTSVTLERTAHTVSR